MQSGLRTMQKIVKSENTTACINVVCQLLSNGGVIAVPTDTIYGFATKLAYVNKLYDVKGRTKTKPVALCVGDIAEIYKWSQVNVPNSLLEDLLPGPVTLVFERSASLPPTINPNTNLVGFRIPNYEFLRELCRKCQEPLALTSANISDMISSLSVEEFRDLWPHLDLVLDGGCLEKTELSRNGSTVVDLSVENTFKINRPGSALHNTVKVLTSSKYNLIERT